MDLNEHLSSGDSAEWQEQMQENNVPSEQQIIFDDSFPDMFESRERDALRSMPIAETIHLADYADMEPVPLGGGQVASGHSIASFGSSNPTDRDNTVTFSSSAAINSLMNGNGETILARELAKLSVSERQEVLHDIHGVTDDDVEETASLINEKLSEMEIKIEQIRAVENMANPNRTSAYSTAETTSSKYVKDPSSRLMFLRASHFNVDQAARRFLSHFEKKMELFGPQKLTKNISMDDLSVDDKDCLTSGQSQLLPYRDRSGRAIFFQALSHYQYEEVTNAMRVIYFILMSAMDDEETQKRGVVCVVYNVEPKSPVANDPRIYLNVYQLLPTIPIRMMGAHYCVQDSNLRQFMSSIRVAMSREVRLRSRVHHGSHEECIYALLTFGIPRKCFPISNAGDLLVDKHLEFLAMRQKQEEANNVHTPLAGTGVSSNSESTPTSPNIVVPKNADILLGRGRPFQEHAGNMRCNFVVMAAMDEYETVSRNDKTGIAKQVIATIKDYGGRFLKQNDGVWEIVDDTEALRKISHSFRTHRQLLKSQQIGGSVGKTSCPHQQQRRPNSDLATAEANSYNKRQKENENDIL